ncbi:YczE/YyaS/YitT family protein [Actinoplanes sp. CA-131856]
MQPRGNRDRRLTRRTVQLFTGLVLYGVSMAFMVESALGLNPWDVFHQGLSEATGVSFGWIVILVGVPVLLLWIPLRQRPGFGTVANLVVVGFAVDGALAVLPAGGTIPARVGYLVGGILLNGLATGLYIGSRFGPGPRDGLMTGVVGRFARLSVRLVRTSIELSVLTVGFFLGGTVGIGTIAYALAIGPLVQLFLPLCTVPGGAERPVLAH